MRLVFLDSNIDELPAATWEAQRVWYEATLAAYDADAAVRGVLVLLHHPPYTNSTVTSDEEHVQRVIVPPLLHAKKTLGLVSGHVHSYERFERGGKMFLVSGGGGGPRARLAEGGARRHPDDLFQGPPLLKLSLHRVHRDGRGPRGRGDGPPQGRDDRRADGSLHVALGALKFPRRGTARESGSCSRRGGCAVGQAPRPRLP